MSLLSIVFFCIIGLKIGVFAELNPASCSLLRTASSVATILPEIAQLTMRYYRSSSSSSPPDQHHRQKRFIYTSKDTSTVKGSVLEQMVANAFKDVNFTKVALLIIHNNETMTKIQQNVDGDTIIRAAMRKIDYEKLGTSLYYGAEANFDLEHFISSIINVTHMDLIHEELLTNGTVPDWLIKTIHPDLNVQTVHQIFEKVKNFTRNFVTIMSSTERFDDYLFNTIQQKILTPLGTIIQKVKNENPTTLDQLVEIILNNVNKVVTEQFTATIKPILSKKTAKDSQSTTTNATPEDNTYDDVELLLYQCSIAIDSIGQTSRVLLKALDQLYCASVWE